MLGLSYQILWNHSHPLWNDSKILIVQKFGDIRFVLELQLELSRMKQRPGESVRRFSEKIELLFDLIHDQTRIFDESRAG